MFISVCGPLLACCFSHSSVQQPPSLSTVCFSQPVTWGHVPISVEAKVLLAQYNVKPHVALRMAQELG